MKLIVLLVCILLQTFNMSLFRDHYRFFDHYLALIRPTLVRLGLTRGWSAIIGVLVPLLLVVFIFNLLFGLVGLLYFIYAILVLLLCLDVRDMKSKLGNYFSAIDSENKAEAQLEVQQLVRQPVEEEKTDLIRAVTGSVLTDSITNIFSVIFWFIVFGPFGAVLYYLVAAITDRANNADFGFDDSSNVATYLKAILDWIPVRLVVLTYALIGHFGPVFNLWVEHLGDGVSENSKLLVESGLTALDADKDPDYAKADENQKAIGLVSRTLWTWVIVIAVLTVTSWLF